MKTVLFAALFLACLLATASTSFAQGQCPGDPGCPGNPAPTGPPNEPVIIIVDGDVLLALADHGPSIPPDPWDGVCFTHEASDPVCPLCVDVDRARRMPFGVLHQFSAA